MSERKRSWGLVGGWITAAYTVVVASIIGLFASDFATELAEMSPNEIGDTLAGFFAPLAFLWLFIATTMQSEELRLQRNEIEENRDVMKEQAAEAKRQAEFLGAQTAAMQRQTKLLKLQADTAVTVAQRQHKISMFDKRIDIYEQLTRISNMDFFNDEIDYALYDRLALVSNRSEFMFDSEFVSWIVQIAKAVEEFVEKSDTANELASEAGQNPVKQIEWVKTKDKIHSELAEIREFLAESLKQQSIMDRIQPYLNLNDDNEGYVRDSSPDIAQAMAMPDHWYKS